MIWTPHANFPAVLVNLTGDSIGYVILQIKKKSFRQV